MKYQGYNNVVSSDANNVAQKVMYDGKEYHDELSLNWYDYGARNYDPTVGRWFNVDPLAEKYRRWSTYNYCMDNPVYFVDPDGMSTKTYTGDAAVAWALSWGDKLAKAANSGMVLDIEGVCALMWITSA